MRNPIFFPAAILAAAMFCTAVNADDSGGGHDWQHQGHHQCGGHHHGHGEMMRELKLSDEQKASIKGFFQSGHGQLKPQFEAVRTQRRALEAATPGSPEFQSAATALAQAESAAASARVQQRTVLMTQIYGVLTPEQKSEWTKLRAEHQAQRDAWRAEHQHEHDTQPAT